MEDIMDQNWKFKILFLESLTILKLGKDMI